MIGEEVIAVYGDAGDGEELFEVQKLVRCRECKHWQPHEQYGYDEDYDEYHDYCGLLVPEDDYYAIERRADDFCSYGSRSEKPNNSTISKMEQVDKDINVRSKDKPQTCSFSDCDNFKNPDYERCIECKRKQIKLKTEQTERSE